MNFTTRFTFTLAITLLGAIQLTTGAAALAETAEQTDWSGGGGVSGPVIDWTNHFSESTGASFAGAGLLSLVCVPTSPVQHTISNGLSLPDAVYPADIDGDGDDDVVAAFWAEDSVMWFENINGAGTWWGAHVVDDSMDGPREICAEDLDGDGDLDLLGAIHAGSRLVWWENINNGSSWAYHTIDGYLRSCTVVRAVDMDNDGDFDALASGVNVSGDLVVWWENENSAADWTEHIITTAPFYPRGLHHADIDGDGDQDVLVGAWNDHEISWWENPLGEVGAWIKHSIDQDFLSPYTVFGADLDGDGDMDLVGGAAQDDEISWWNNLSGDGTTWEKQIINGDTSSAHYVMAIDVDFDGDMDVLGASFSDNTVAWYENRGDASSWIQHIISNSFEGADMVRVGDFDNNGTLDAVGAAYLGQRVDWWEIVEYVDTGELTSSILDTENPALAWDDWTLDATQPDGTSLSVEARASNDADDMGSWVQLLPGDLASYLENGQQYLQYRLSLSTTDYEHSPTLSSLEFNWSNTTSAVVNPGVGAMFAPYPNPSNSGFRVSYSLHKAGNVELSVYDLAGKRIEVIFDREKESGRHSLNWNASGLASGVYFLRLSAAGEVFTRQVVISQ